MKWLVQQHVDATVLLCTGKQVRFHAFDWWGTIFALGILLGALGCYFLKLRKFDDIQEQLTAIRQQTAPRAAPQLSPAASPKTLPKNLHLGSSKAKPQPHPESIPTTSLPPDSTQSPQ